MESHAIRIPQDSPATRPVELVLLRANAPLFFSLAAASVLETAASRHCERMLRLFEHDAEFRAWIENDWMPAKVARAKQLRDYVRKTWPEFDWTAAYEQYEAAAGSCGAPAAQRPTAAHEALARCVAAAQGAVFYRALARWADDWQLRDMARNLAHAEAASFARFRAAFDRACRVKRMGFAAAWRTALGCVRSARDTHVRLAFEALSAQWQGPAPFPQIDYAEFLARMRAVVVHRAQLHAGERLVFHGWRKPVRVAARPAPSVPGWFRPVLASANG
jgi:hypothetical protein